MTRCDTARLLAYMASRVFVDDRFALDGGAASNPFVRDIPPLPVDLDLVFPGPALPRVKALQRIHGAFRRSANTC